MNILQVKNTQIVAGNEPIRLRGTCIGGWMNMENFINGYPGAEYSLRAVMAETIGEGKTEFFFRRLLDYFFTEADVQFIAQTGSNVVRLPLNYRHFEQDSAPFEYLEAGFERLDQAVKWCGKHGLYAILDMHAVQGWQNTDWHSDNTNRQSLFWEHPHFQDRFIALWEEIARRYKGNPTIAGYDVMNEPLANVPRGRFGYPVVSGGDRFNQVYRRVVSAIRRIDPDHIIFLEGDGFAWRFDGMEPPFAENLVYSSHNYNGPGFGPGAYPGEFWGGYWDRKREVEFFLQHEGTRYTQKYNVPLWVGEFGAVYNGLESEIPDRLRAIADQISVFEEFDAHWTTWTYKDVGVMGWVTLTSDSPYMEHIRPISNLKEEMHTDFWMHWLPTTPIKARTQEIADLIFETVGDADLNLHEVRQYTIQTMLDHFAGGLLQYPYAKRFKGLSENELDTLAASFALEKCRVNAGLIEIIQKFCKG